VKSGARESDPSGGTTTKSTGGRINRRPNGPKGASLRSGEQSLPGEKMGLGQQPGLWEVVRLGVRVGDLKWPGGRRSTQGFPEGDKGDDLLLPVISNHRKTGGFERCSNFTPACRGCRSTRSFSEWEGKSCAGNPGLSMDSGHSKFPRAKCLAPRGLPS